MAKITVHLTNISHLTLRFARPQLGSILLDFISQAPIGRLRSLHLYNTWVEPRYVLDFLHTNAGLHELNLVGIEVHVQRELRDLCSHVATSRQVTEFGLRDVQVEGPSSIHRLPVRHVLRLLAQQSETLASNHKAGQGGGDLAVAGPGVGLAQKLVVLL